MRVHSRLVPVVRVLLVVLVVAYGALLRLDAISQTYDPVQAPRWLQRLELSRAGPSRLRPADMYWDASPRYPHKEGLSTQYRSDPYTYLLYAREMRSFYAAHPREPLFPFVTKLWLRLLHDSDTAVSFASAAFSVLAIALTFALGAEAFSYGVGLVAAALWAIEYDVITSGTEGWRDDAFVCAVLLTAWLALRFARQRSTRLAVALGVAAGAACLVRITAISFVMPAWLYLLVTGGGPWRARLRDAGAALAAMLVVVAPYLVNCWRVYGDPLYSINVHAGVYRATEGQPAASEGSAREYITGHLRSRPATTVDTFVVGLTQYPFANKWTGLTPWHPRLGRWLAAAALAGLFLWLGLPQGRLLLIVLAASLVPFAVTWRLIADWRFTEHAYPFFLIAACSAVWCAARAIDRRGRLVEDRRAARSAMLAWAAGVVCIAALWIVCTRVTPRMVFAETVRAGEPATILAGDRDSTFFPSDWPRVVKRGIPTRVAAGPRATIVVPLAAAADYDVLIRVDPSPEPMTPGATVSPIQVLLNGRLIARCEPGSAPDRIGACGLVFPSDAVRDGVNRVTLVTEQPSGFRVWYLRVTKKPV